MARGVPNAKKLIDLRGEAHCKTQMENFDHRRAMGDDVGAGWLGKACAEEKGFGFRKDFVSSEEREDRKSKLAARAAAVAAERRQAEESRRQAEITEEAMVEGYLKNIGSKRDLEAFQKEALAANKFTAEQYRRAKQSGGDASVYLEVAVKAYVLKKLAEESQVVNASA